MTGIFSTGLSSVLEEIDNQQVNNPQNNEEFKSMLLKIEDGVKYKCRVLTEQDQFLAFKEYNWVPVNYHSKKGAVIQGNASFFAKGGPEDPLATTKLIDPNTNELKPLRSRSVLAIPVYIQSMKVPGKRGGKDMVEEVGEVKILILPPGKNQQTWRMLLDSSEESGSLTDKYYTIYRKGKGVDTVWGISPNMPTPFAEEDQVTLPDVQAIIQGCGRWKDPSNIKNPNDPTLANGGISLRGLPEEVMDEDKLAFEDDTANKL